MVSISLRRIRNESCHQNWPQTLFGTNLNRRAKSVSFSLQPAERGDEEKSQMLGQTISASITYLVCLRFGAVGLNSHGTQKRISVTIELDLSEHTRL